MVLQDVELFECHLADVVNDGVVCPDVDAADVEADAEDLLRPVPRLGGTEQRPGVGNASPMPAAIQRFFIVPSRQCFTRPVVVRVMEISTRCSSCSSTTDAADQ